MRYSIRMKLGKAVIDPYALMALLVMGVSVYICITVYFYSHYIVFTSEEQIEAQKQSEFGYLANFL